MKKISLVALFFAPMAALAHAFGQQYTLPLPVSFYITGGVAAFIASCAFLIFVEPNTTTPAFGHPSSTEEGKKTLLTFSERGWKILTWLVQSVLFLILMGGILMGLFGSQEPSENLLVYLFWLGLVLAAAYLSVLTSGWWEIGNPFRTGISWVVRENTTTSPRGLGSPPQLRRREEGRKTGYTPAVIGYVLLILLELFFQEWGTSPRFLAIALLVCAVYLCVGSMFYGIEKWFRHADFFTLFFRLAGMLSPFRLEEGKLVVSSPARRLIFGEVTKLSLVVFIIFALAATAFDGFRETELMYLIAEAGSFLSFEAWSFIVFASLPFMFFGLFAGTIWVMKRLVDGKKPLRYYLLRFSLSLVPIVLAYHFAHYFPLLFSYAPRVLIGADKIWYIQLAVIVLGHAFAAYVAHRIALVEFTIRKQALLSQLPLLVLMVFYTAFGLWILSQPFASF